MSGAAIDTPEKELGDKIRSANINNIIARLKAGKTLNKTEQDALDAYRGGGGDVEPTRLRKNRLALALGVSRVTLDAYLNRGGEPTAPLPDSAGEYDVEDVARYISEIKGDESKKKGIAFWEAEKRRLQCEELVHRMQVQRGQYISREEASRTLGPLMGELGELLRMEFELRLPAEYRGRDTVECAALNRAAIDKVIARFRAGSGALVSAA